MSIAYIHAMRWNTVAGQLFTSTAECECVNTDGDKAAKERSGMDGDLNYSVILDVLLLHISCLAVVFPSLEVPECGRGVNWVSSRCVSCANNFTTTNCLLTNDGNYILVTYQA